jgi:broad-specificity NMP kinase
MGLCLVTGVSGTGKSTVLGELRRRGCLARGVDEDGYADWVSRRTGAAETIPRDDPAFDIHAWYRAHDWVLNARRVSVLSRAAARCARPVFLCGSALGEDRVWHLFDRVVALVADAPTIARRLAARAGDYGKAPEELAMILGWREGSEESYRRFGAVIVDATCPPHQVTEEILAAIAGWRRLPRQRPRWRWRTRQGASGSLVK